jgi:hypothetical protein
LDGSAINKTGGAVGKPRRLSEREIKMKTNTNTTAEIEVSDAQSFNLNHPIAKAIGATYVYANRDGRNKIPEVLAELWQVSFQFETTEAAEAFAARFPKYCKVQASTIGIDGGRRRVPYVACEMDARTTTRYRQQDKRTGSVNEAAEKRRAKILEVLNAIAAESEK